MRAAVRIETDNCLCAPDYCRNHINYSIHGGWSQISAEWPKSLQYSGVNC